MKPEEIGRNQACSETSSAMPPPLCNISADARIKEYLRGLDAQLCRGNVLLQSGQFGYMETVIPRFGKPESK